MCVSVSTWCNWRQMVSIILILMIIVISVTIVITTATTTITVVENTHQLKSNTDLRVWRSSSTRNRDVSRGCDITHGCCRASSDTYGCGDFENRWKNVCPLMSRPNHRHSQTTNNQNTLIPDQIRQRHDKLIRPNHFWLSRIRLMNVYSRLINK